MAIQNPSLPDEFTCDLCGESFTSVSDLNEHKHDYHERPSRQAQEENRDTQRDIGEPGLPTAPQR
ncbi:MAG TPA: hypothetical protein VGM92_10320 [Candidatus Kapabacteria bacterium]|jgi:hypothetical protein